MSKTPEQAIFIAAISSDRPPLSPKRGDIYFVLNSYGGDAQGEFRGKEGKHVIYDGNIWEVIE